MVVMQVVDEEIKQAVFPKLRELLRAESQQLEISRIAVFSES